MKANFIPAEQVDIKARVAFNEVIDFGQQEPRVAGVIFKVIPQDQLDQMQSASQELRDLLEEHSNDLLSVQKDASFKLDEEVFDARKVDMENLSQQQWQRIEESILGYAFEDENGDWVAVELSESDHDKLQKKTDFRAQLVSVFFAEQKAAIRKN